MTTEHNCAEAVRWLECPRCKGEGSMPFAGIHPGDYCDTCKGTRLRFGMLSEECPCTFQEVGYCGACGWKVENWQDPDSPSEFIHDSDCNCHSGRIAVDTLDSWMDVADALGGWEFARYATMTGYSFTLHSFYDLPKAARVSTRQGAIAKAVCKALSQHPEVVDPLGREVTT